MAAQEIPDAVTYPGTDQKVKMTAVARLRGSSST